MAKKRPGKLEADRGSGSIGTSAAVVLAPGQHAEREENRQGLAELDRMTEHSDRLSRRQKDANRILPRDGTKEVHPRKRRDFQHPDDLRLPMSRRQRSERANHLRATQQRWTSAQARDIRALAGGEELWHNVNDQLSAHTGDIDALSTRDKARVRRLDRAIRQYEETNDRNHVLYTALELPAGLRPSDIKEGESLTFDRFTMTRHNIHEVPGADFDSTPVVEISTSRGMYLATRGPDTPHLLPRGMKYRVGQTYQAMWRDADGNEGMRPVIRLHAVQEEEE